MKINIFIVLLLLLSNVITAVLYVSHCSNPRNEAAGRQLVGHTHELIGFYTNDLHVSNPQQHDFALDSVFQKLWSTLPDTIYVYPSEGYYYYSGYIGDSVIRGNIGFFHAALDKRKISINCEIMPSGNQPEYRIVSWSVKIGQVADPT